MIYAYDEIYLGKARTTLAWMFDYGVNGCEMDIQLFYQMFLTSAYVHRFEAGDCSVVAGMSGIELAQRIIRETQGVQLLPEPVFSLNRSPEYWLGFYLAYYQWYRNMTYAQITERITITDMLALYHKYHEMDVMNFVVEVDSMRNGGTERQIARLQEYRKRLGISQRELAEKSRVPVRTIQQYEQRQKKISHGRVDYIISMSKVLHCRPEDLIEPE